jgi:HK97 family phage major capsid protein
VKSKELREKRAEIAKQMHDLCRKADSENRALNPEEQQIFDRMDSEQQEHLTNAEGYERQEKFQQTILDATKSSNPDFKRAAETFARYDDGDKAIQGWLAHKFLTNRNGADPQHKEGVQKVASQFRGHAERWGLDYASDKVTIPLYERAPKSLGDIRSSSGQSSVVSNLGAEFVPKLLANQIEIYLLAYSEVRKYAMVLRTPEGGPFTIPYSDDTSNASVIIGQGSNDSVLDIPTNKLSISSYMFTTREIYVPIEWARDSKFPVMQFVSDQLGTRHARGQAQYLTTGAGSTQPQGFVTGATSNGNLTSTTNAITYTDMLNLHYSVPGAYRRSPNYAIVGSDSAVKAVRAIVSTTGFPLWQPSLQANTPDTFFGAPLLTNWNMAAMGTTNATVMVAGDFHEFFIRDVGEFELVIDPYSRMATNRQIIVAGHGALDSIVLNPNAFAYLETPSASSIVGP